MRRPHSATDRGVELKIAGNGVLGIVTVKGPPWRTTVIVQWVATATLANDDPYVNPGAHIITMQWGKVYSFYAYEDSQAVAAGLAKQAQAGIKEAAAPKIES